MIHKILIANRGEIAVRIIKTVHEMGLNALAVYSRREEHDLHVLHADEAVLMEGDSLAGTYLNAEEIISIAKTHQCDAIHPGYGFLSENHDFAKACEANGLVFIGPSSRVIGLMGNKTESKQKAVSLDIPVIPQYDATNLPDGMSYPVIIKASGGGGGKGMAVVHHPEDLNTALEAARQAAGTYFGNEHVFIEQYIPDARHIEIQVLGDRKGNMLSLFERECSVQRNYQKIIEEAPAKNISVSLREKLSLDALKLSGAIGYSGAGTVEFLVDRDENYYFMEMNTRIQVEHPVTEMITGLDIVNLQILVAGGHVLPLKQKDVQISGHAIEARLYAENPATNYHPSPGKILGMTLHADEGIRIDKGVDRGGMIHSSFDPTIMKIIAWGTGREEARLRLRRALQESIVHGVDTNKQLLMEVLSHPDFIGNRLSVSFLRDNRPVLMKQVEDRKKRLSTVVPVFAYLFAVHYRPPESGRNTWQTLGAWRISHRQQLYLDDQPVSFKYLDLTENTAGIIWKDTFYRAVCLQKTTDTLSFVFRKKQYKLHYCRTETGMILETRGILYTIRIDALNSINNHNSRTKKNNGMNGKVYSPVPGKIVKITNKKDELVEQGDVLVIVESMKMENQIKAPYRAVIKDIDIHEGNMVTEKTVLIRLNPL